MQIPYYINTSYSVVRAKCEVILSAQNSPVGDLIPFAVREGEVGGVRLRIWGKVVQVEQPNNRRKKIARGWL